MKQVWRPLFVMFSLALLASFLLSCGGTSTTNCALTGLNVSPASGIADHTAIAPGNQVQYSASAKLPDGCVMTALLPVMTWTTSDATNTTISNAPGMPGLATCVNATPQTETITASLPGGSVSGTATLSCK